MITKNVTKRITDTLTTIATTPHFPPPERARVHAFASAFVNTHYPATNARSAGYTAFSTGMTMTDVAAAGSEEQRAMRRAIYLLWHAMGEPPHAARVKMVLAGDVRAVFVATMQKALCRGDGAAGDPAGGKYVFKNAFRADPLQFLQRNMIMISGVTTVGPGTRNMLRFKMEFNAWKDRYEFSIVDDRGAGGCHSFDATSVPAVYWADVPGRTTALNAGSFAGIRGTEMAGKYMVTTQFTGCSFCLKQTGGGLFAAHVSPGYKGPAREAAAPGIDGTLLARQLCGTEHPVVGGDFGNAPASPNPFHVFGKEHSNLPGQTGYDARCTLGGGQNWMSLFGFNRTGAWEIYCQEVIAGGIGDVSRIM